MNAAPNRSALHQTIADLAAELDAALIRLHDSTAGSANEHLHVDHHYMQLRPDDTTHLGVLMRLGLTADQLRRSNPASLHAVAREVCLQAGELVDLGAVTEFENSYVAEGLDKVADNLDTQAKVCRQIAEQMRIRGDR